MRARGLAVSGDAVLVAVVCALAWGCAGSAPAVQRPRDPGGAIYDSAGEWRSDRPAVALAPRPGRLRASIALPDGAADLELPELSAAFAREGARIAAVQPIVDAVARARGAARSHQRGDLGREPLSAARAQAEVRERSDAALAAHGP